MHCTCRQFAQTCGDANDNSSYNSTILFLIIIVQLRSQQESRIKASTEKAIDVIFEVFNADASFNKNPPWNMPKILHLYTRQNLHKMC